MITSLKENQIFVCGTNTAGLHYGGAAKQAWEDFGLVWGVGEGLSGRSYAFPTLDGEFNKLKIRSLVNSRNRLYKSCEVNKDNEYILTKVGCGIAGYQENEMKDLFIDPPNNLILPEDWR